MRKTVFRFMSNTEHRLLVEGKVLYNHTDHGRCFGQTATTSVGFCFGIGGFVDAVRQSRYLKGIVCMGWVMVAEYDDEQPSNVRMRESVGRYVTKFDSMGNAVEHGYFSELCTERLCVYDFLDVQFKPVCGIRQKRSSKFELNTAILASSITSKRERWLLRLSNAIALQNMVNCSVPASSLEIDFTRRPISPNAF